MKSGTPVNKFSILLGGLLSAVVLSTNAFAQHGGGGGGGHAGGGGGGGHAGGGAHAVAGGHYGGGYAGGGYRGGYAGGYRGGYGYGGYRGGYGYGGFRGGYGYGWRGGYGCCGWGWGWGGLGLGLYFASLPFYYNTYYWGGVPYYYADNTYYIYDPSQKQYETVAPPQGVEDQAATANGGSSGAPPDIIAYPKNGQSADQQAKDKFECHQWAAGQTGFDPTQGSSTAPATKRNDYMRAQAACLEGRGYSVN